MKRKFINLLCVSAALVAGMGTLFSCKDNDEDVFAELKTQNTNQKLAWDTQFGDLKTDFTNLGNALADSCRNLQQSIQNANNRIGDLEQKMKDDSAAIMDVIHADSLALAGSISGLAARHENDSTEVWKKFGELATKYTNDSSAWADEIQGLKDTLAYYVTIEQWRNSVDSVNARIDSLINNINSCKCNFTEDSTKILEAVKNLGYITAEDLMGEGASSQSVIEALSAAITATQTGGVVEQLAQALGLNEGGTPVDLSDLDEIRRNISTLQATLGSITNAQLQSAIAEATWVSTNKAALDAVISYVNDTLRTVPAKVDTLVAQMSDVRDSLAILDETLSAAVRNIDSLATVTSNLGAVTDSLANVTSNLGAVTDSLANVTSNLGAVTDSLANVTDSLGNLIDEINGAVNTLTTRVDSLAGEITTLKGRVDTLTSRVDNIENRVDNIENRLDSMLTNILVQATYNPAYGTFAAPANISSNMLMLYFGEYTSQDFNFPGTAFGTGHELNSDIDSAITYTSYYKDILRGSDSYEVKNGILMQTDEEGKGWAGTLYATLNPANVDLTGKSFSLVSSTGRVSKVTLGEGKPSEKELTFGYTRAEASENGFYEFNATLAPEDVSEVKINVEPGLKSAVSSYLSNFTTRNGLTSVASTQSVSDLVRLAQKLSNQFDGILPANALKASWEAGGKNYNVYSQYAIGATAFKPLSFAFLKDYNMPQIPKITIFDNLKDLSIKDIIGEIDSFKIEYHYENINLGMGDVKFKIEFPTIDEFDIDVSDVSINVPVVVDTTFYVHVEIKMENFPTGNATVYPQYKYFTEAGDTLDVNWTVVNGDTVYNTAITDSIMVGIDEKIAIEKVDTAFFANDTIPFEITTDVIIGGEDLKPLIDAISGSITETINDMFKDMGESMNDQIDSVFQSIFSDLEDKINEQIGGMINGLLDNMSDQVNGYIQGMVDQIVGSADSLINGYMGTLTNYVDQMNNVIDRVNGVLANANHYLQPILLYKNSSGSLGMLSQSAAAPSVLTVTGDAVPLYATTFTADVAVPSFKKYIAVVDVMKGGKWASEGNAEAEAALQAANRTDANITRVMSGKTTAAALQVQKGCTYKVLYSALDYAGNTSSNFYYVMVRE